MPDGNPSHRLLAPFTLGDWLVDPRACHATRGDVVVKLRPQLVDLLQCLARRPGEIVLKDEILAEVWPGQFIAESGLTRCVAELRQLLQDDTQHPKFIETIPKRGYRLAAPVEWAAGPGIQSAAPPQPHPHPAAPAEEGAEATGPEAGPAPAAPPDADGGRHPKVGRVGLWSGAALVALSVAVVAFVATRRAPAEMLTDQDPVLLAFENKTGDAVFDETIPLAVAIQMQQSPYLALLSPWRIQETLSMMRRPRDTPITRSVGMEICERVGGRALIVTSIASLGSQYAIGLEAVACGTGDVMARRQVTTDRKEHVLAGLQRAAVEIRRAVGEPAASLERYQLPIVEATTVSLDALRAVRRGDVARERGQPDLALGFYREAVALDPGFALGQSRLGAVSIGDEQLAALEKAHALRDRVTFNERLEIEAQYNRTVTGDRARVLEALEALSRFYPRRAVPHRDLAVEYMTWGRYEAALGEAREALRLEPDSALNVAAVARAHLFLGQVAEARKAAEEAIAFGATAVDLHRALYYCALAAGDEALLQRERAWATRQTGVPLLLEDEAEEAVNDGRLRQALALMRQYEGWANEVKLPDVGVRMRLRAARYQAICGFGARAVRAVQAELRREMSPTARMDAVRAAAAGGGLELAERLLDELDRTGYPGEWGSAMARTYRAAIASRRGRVREALDLLSPLENVELGYMYSLEPLLVRAETLLRAGEWKRAAEAFQKIIANSTIDSARKILPLARIGLARALAGAGDVAGSREAYRAFLEKWKGADDDLPLLAEARREQGDLGR